MNNLKQKIESLLTIDLKYIFDGNGDEFRRRLSEQGDINYERLSENEIVFTPSISGGTMTISDRWFFSIRLRALLLQDQANWLSLNLKTSIRLEHYAIMVLFIFLFTGIIFSQQNNRALYFLLPIWLVCHFWFQLVFRY